MYLTGPKKKKKKKGGVRRNRTERGARECVGEL